jgi:hypothetical protein
MAFPIVDSAHLPVSMRVITVGVLEIVINFSQVPVALGSPPLWKCG